jgi:hypothetical protein
MNGINNMNVSERYLRNSGCGVKMTNAYSLVVLDLEKRDLSLLERK